MRPTPFRRLPVVLAAGLMLGACGRDEARPSLAPGIDLARVGTIGDLPGEANRVLVTLDAEGTLAVDRAGVDVEGLEEVLMRRARGGPTALDGRSALDLVLAVDRTIPWEAVMRLLKSAAHPRVKMDRVHFAVLPESGVEEGALATFLPSGGP